MKAAFIPNLNTICHALQRGRREGPILFSSPSDCLLLYSEGEDDALISNFQLRIVIRRYRDDLPCRWKEFVP